MALVRQFLNKKTSDALEAAETLRDYCKSIDCSSESCIFHRDGDDCLLMSEDLNNNYIERGELPAPEGWRLDLCD